MKLFKKIFWIVLAIFILWIIIAHFLYAIEENSAVVNSCVSNFSIQNLTGEKNVL